MIASGNRRRVVVTGVGVINPLGNDIETVWSAIKEGKSGVGYTTIFDASKFPTRISAEIKDWDISSVVDDPKLWELRGRHTKFAAGAAIQAFQASGVGDSITDPRRFGVYMGSGEGNQDFLSFASMMASSIKDDGSLDLAEFTRAGLDQLNPVVELEQEPNMPVGHIASLFNAQGPNANCLTACAASNQAVGEATEIIRRGEADVMLSGGTHSMIHPFGVTGFNLLTALSTNNDNPQGASRPFDRLRDGFVLGEGAGAIVLEEYEYAKARGAKIYAEVIGGGMSSDAHHMTAPHPEGIGVIAVMKNCLENSGIQPEDVDHINTHGTSTPLGDVAELKAISEVFGDHAKNININSTKSMTGHLLGAAGAIESIASILAMKHGIVPPTINHSTADENINPDLNLTLNKPQKRAIKVAMSNTFGFGGHNACVAFRKID